MKKARTLSLLLALALALAALAGCEKKESPGKDAGEGPKKPVVAVTIAPQQAFVEAVCGNLVEVVSMVPPGSSAETYEPAPGQMEKFSDASLYFAVGVPVEEAYILPNIGGIQYIRLQDEVNAAYPPLVFENGEPDPHIWLSPKRAKVMVSAIAREMAVFDPENAETYEKNAEAYNLRLDELDEYIRSIFLDAANKAFIVYHPAFGYFADDYGLTMYALEEEGKEATAQRIREMIDLAREKNITTVFYQEEIDGSQSAQFAEEIGGTSAMLSPLSADYIDSLIAMADALREAMK